VTSVGDAWALVGLEKVNLMSDIPPIHLSTQAPAAVGSNGAHHRPVNGQAPVPADTVEISELGQRLSALANDPDIRLEKVQALRLAIAEGTYETQEKLDATVARLVEVLRNAEPYEPEIPNTDEQTT
jgi:flagellar biosynthesis anti-sigma factor FlgM